MAGVGSQFEAHRRRKLRKQRLRVVAIGVGAFSIAFGAGLAISRPGLLPAVWQPSAAEPLASTDSFTCTVSSVHDGDTFRCRERGPDGREIKIRLSGVAARELDGTCSPGHPCPAASAEDATAELRRLALGKALSCEAVGTSYSRVAAFCQRPDGIDLSCAMVESGLVLKWDRHWGRHRC